MRLTSRGADSARGIDKSSAPQEGVGNAGCPVHPQPRVRSGSSKCTRVFTAVARENHPAAQRDPISWSFDAACNGMCAQTTFAQAEDSLTTGSTGGSGGGGAGGPTAIQTATGGINTGGSSSGRDFTSNGFPKLLFGGPGRGAGFLA